MSSSSTQSAAEVLADFSQQQAEELVQTVHLLCNEVNLMIKISTNFFFVMTCTLPLISIYHSRDGRTAEVRMELTFHEKLWEPSIL